MPRSIKIVDTNNFTTRNRARRFVKSEKARWTDSTHTAIIFDTNYRMSRSYQPPSLADLIAETPPAWEECYRTTAAAVLPPSAEWLTSRRTSPGRVVVAG